MDLIGNWKIQLPSNFRRIDNGDSVQLQNESGSRTIYSSVIGMERLGITAEKMRSIVTQLTKEKEGDNFHFKFYKSCDTELLIVVITCTDEKDEKWAMGILESVVHGGH